MKNRATTPIPRMGVRVSRFESGRVCDHPPCATVLSVYNSAEYCSLHEPRTRRTGGTRP
ncbi:MAG: hypothetical protein ABR600_02640 [Actinomycetota bacterium]